MKNALILGFIATAGLFGSGCYLVVDDAYYHSGSHRYSYSYRSYPGHHRYYHRSYPGRPSYKCPPNRYRRH